MTEEAVCVGVDVAITRFTVLFNHYLIESEYEKEYLAVIILTNKKYGGILITN